MARMRFINALAFHPNPAGANASADAIIRALEPLMKDDITAEEEAP